MDEPVIIHSDGSRDFGRIVAIESVWELSFGPCDLSFIRIDHQTRLQFGETEVVIESPFLLQVGDEEYRLSERADLGPLLGLYPAVLTEATVDRRATLHLTFDSGATLAVPPDPHYEAWQVNGPGTFLVVCVPGTSGELAIWS